MGCIEGFRFVFNELIYECETNQRELSKILQTDPCMIVKWKDQVKDLRLSTLLKIADHYECSLEFLCAKTTNQLDYIPKPCPFFGEWLPTLLKERNISFYKIYKNTKIKRSHCHRWRNGQEPMLSSLEVLARYLNVTLDHLVGRNR